MQSERAQGESEPDGSEGVAADSDREPARSDLEPPHSEREGAGSDPERARSDLEPGRSDREPPHSEREGAGSESERADSASAGVSLSPNAGLEWMRVGTAQPERGEDHPRGRENRIIPVVR